MSDASIYKGGRSVLNYMFCEGDYPQYTPPFGNPNIVGTPPYDAHACGAYNLGYFTMGMPIRPSLMKYQYNALSAANLQVGDIIRCIVIPADHYVRAFNIKCVEEDERMIGATVMPTAQLVTKDTNGNFVWAEINDVENVFTSAGYSPIALDETSNAAVFFDMPLYVEPETAIVIGLRIESLPTDPTVAIEDALNGWYMSVKFECFECPTNL